MNDPRASVPEYDETTPILIVGGSLVGLSASLFLSSHGISSILVESHAGISPHPRAVDFNMRTMELFRAAGVEQAIREAEPAEFRNSSVLQAESLNGRELNWISHDTTENTISPVQGSLLGQDVLEPILRQHARAAGSDLRFGTDLISFTQDEHGVSALIKDRATDTLRSVRARYLIAADGNRSSIRKQLGIEVHGPGLQGHQLSILFSADIQAPLRDRRIAICFVNNPQLRGATLILARGEKNGYGLYAPYHPENGESEADFKGERGIELVRHALGVSDLPIQIMNVRSWEVAAWAAARFQQERVFLVGDAAHVNPPTGAFGANTGIADAYNLTWKLAYVLNKNAGPELLETYSPERQPVARHTGEQAFAMFSRFASAGTNRPTAQIVPYDATAFGYRYHSDAVLAQDDDTTSYEDPHLPTGRPGTHAPHVVLQRQHEQFSTFDLFGQRLILLTGSNGQSWQQAAQSVATHTGLPLDTYRVGDDGDLQDPTARFLSTYAIESDGAVLIRPDGFIGWRAQHAEDQPEHVLEHVLATLLARPELVTHHKVTVA